MTAKTCLNCRYCEVPTNGEWAQGRCTVIHDPVTGDDLPPQIARQDTWGNYKMPCGYAGAMWEAKT